MKLLNLDWFTKFQDTSLTDSSRAGGIFTLLVFAGLGIISWAEIQDAFAVRHEYEYLVDSTRSTAPSLQINIDMTVHTPCKYLRIDLLDVSREGLALKDKVKALDVMHLA